MASLMRRSYSIFNELLLLIMKKINLFSLKTMMLATILLAASCTDRDNSIVPEPTPLTDAEKAALLEKAYVYTLPLMLVDATYQKMTNTVKPTESQAPANYFVHNRELTTADNKEIVTPNADTNYSQIMMDLSEDALVVRLPHTERFCIAQTLDAWTNCIAAPDATTIDGKYGFFCFTGPNFNEQEDGGKITKEMTRIKCPTNQAWMLLRTLCKGEKDLQNVIDIQNEMKTYRLDDFAEQKEYDGTGTKVEGIDDIPPVTRIMTMSMEEFFAQANKLMLINPPAPADASWVNDISRINVGPGLTFDASIFGDKKDALWKNLVSNIIPTTLAQSQQFIKVNGPWNFYGEPIAEFGTEFYYRAMVAVAAIAANPVSIAVYPRAAVDSEGARLNGNKSYKLHIEPDNWPETNDYGFWSITLYGEDDFFYDNPQKRYNITDRDSVSKNDDGSLDIYIQHNEPAADKKTNWLPAPADEFHLIFRIYNPVERISKNLWTMPSITIMEAKGPNDSGTYYQKADGKKGAELKTALCGIIYNRSERTYGQLWGDFMTTDIRSDGKIWDMYSNITNYEPVTSGSNYKIEGDCYNREHSFPNSWFGKKIQPMYTDLHHLYPTDGYVNNRRGNYPFGETDGEKYKSANDFSKLGACTYPGYTDMVFEPADEYKGDFARTYFYMVTCYEEKIVDWYNNYADSRPTLDGNTYPGLSDWQLSMLMKWAQNDPVSEKEINRNNAVFGIQNNRNPFIDYPELEQYIWGELTDSLFSYDNYQKPKH